MRHTICAPLLVASAGLFLVGANAPAQTGAKGGEWKTYGGDLGSTRYSPLDQINARNFNSLEVAWRFKTENLGPRPEFQYEATPLMVGGKIYSTGGSRRAVFALDAATGEQLWVYSLNEGARGQAAPRLLSGHGLSYWTDGKEERIVYVTPGYQMIALSARTGQPIPAFGKGGVVDLKQDDDQEIDLVTGEIGLHSTPIIAKDVIVVGAAHLSGGVPKSKRNAKGYVRGFDARTGKRKWIFHTIPRPGEYGYDTWLNDSADYTGNTGVWGQMSVDEDLGMVYVPVELPTGDYYGGNRPGSGLFGESIVALDLQTGKRKWHYQTVHHGVWDMDIPCAPILTNITVNGRSIKALAQPTKQDWLYILDRTNGQPVYPIEERPVPQGDVPGEWYSPTQPFVTKPPSYGTQGVKPDDLINFTPALHEEALKLITRYKIGPMFTPPSVATADGTLGTIISPGAQGGTNWPGGSYDPETRTVYVYSKTEIAVLGLIPAGNTTDFGWVQGRPGATPRLPSAMGAPPAGGGRGGRGGGAPGGGEGGGPGVTVQGLPLMKPPYGTITAIDLEKGDFRWQIAHGETPDNIKNHPALKGLNIPRTGRVGIVGPLSTKTLVICGEPGFATTPAGRGAMLRAYDKMTGQEVGAVYMNAPQSGSPMTYMLNGEQYIVVAISGAGYSGELLAFKLPKE